MKSQADFSSTKPSASISNSRIAREIFQLQTNEKNGALPDGVQFQINDMNSGDGLKKDAEYFTISIMPEVFGGSESIVLEFTLHYRSYPFSPPTVVCASGLEEFCTEIQKKTSERKDKKLAHHFLGEHWTPSITICQLIGLLVEELKNPLVQGKLPNEGLQKESDYHNSSASLQAPVCFIINDVIHTDDIPAATFIKCEVDVGGSRFPRYVAINPHSIFTLETHNTELGKVIVRSQRALLEIARVSYTLGKAVRIIYKASQGGDSCTFFTNSPEACVAAIRQSLAQLGIQGNEAPSGGAGNSGIQSKSSTSNNRGNARKLAENRKFFTPTKRFGGGGRNESPFDSITRLEREMRARPTISVVRGIMDRYRRLIEQCSADSRLQVQNRVQTLTKDLQKFLQRPEVIRTLSSQEQIEKQRHRRRRADSMVLYEETFKGVNISNRKEGDEPCIDGIDGTPIASATENEQAGNEVIGSPGGGTMQESSQQSSGWCGTPYNRAPGEVYLSTEYNKSQVNHARVAETGTLLPGRVVVNFIVKPPPVTHSLSTIKK
jgi:ubiquitin-protein ligase